MINTDREAELEAHAQRIADAAPPLTDHQRETLRLLLRPAVDWNAPGVTGNARVPARVTYPPQVRAAGNG